MRRVFLAVLIVLVIPAFILATPGVKPKKAVWEPNPEADLAGYFLYWGSNVGNFNDTDRVDVGNVVEYNLDDVPGPKIAITAYDTTGNESEYSNEVNLDNTAPGANSTLSVVPQ